VRLRSAHTVGSGDQGSLGGGAATRAAA
jgi:hypothetical protein